jgi:TolB-like protein
MPQNAFDSKMERTVPREAALDALDRVLVSKAFGGASRLRELLRFLVQRTLDADRGRLKEQEVGAAVYGRELSYDPHTDPVVRVAARQLRFKLADYYATEGQSDPVLITLPKGGYMAAFAAREPGDSPGGGQTWTAAGKPFPRNLVAAMALAGVVIGTASWLMITHRPVPRLRSIVVLPFQNLTGDPAKEFVSDGLTEELTGALVRIPELRVVARTSAYQFKGRGEDIRAIGQKLNVDAVLEGSVLQASSRVRVTAQLNRTADGYHIWAEQYDRDARDASSLQGDIARDVSPYLESGWKAPAAQPKPQTVEARNAYLMGRYLFNQRSQPSLRKGMQYFEKAIALDPNYATANASLASSWLVLFGNDYVSPAQAAPEIRKFATRAAALDPTLGDPHATLGLLSFEYDWNWPVARRELERAIELSSGDELCHHFYAVALLWEGLFPEAIGELRKAIELDPLSAAAKGGLVFFYAYARQPDRAIQASKEVIDDFPNSYMAHASLGTAYEEKHSYSAAIVEFEKEMALTPGDSDGLRRAAHAYAVSGNAAKARILLDKLLHPSAGSYIPPIDPAAVYAGLGDKADCLSWLNRGVAERAASMTQLVVDPAFDAMRSDREFQAIVQRVGLWGR